MWWRLRQLWRLLQLERIEETMSGGWLESSEIEPLLPKARRSSAPAIFLRQMHVALPCNFAIVHG
jgi:hypothetical protein